MRIPTVLTVLMLSFTPVVAQKYLRQGLVVRYDAATVRLHEDLLEVLLSPALCLGVQSAVWGKDVAQEPLFSVSVFPLNITQNASEWFQQPEGVFAGNLKIDFHEAAPPENRPAIGDALLAALQDSLKQRLTEGPRNWLARQRDAVFKGIVRAEEQLHQARVELHTLPAGSPEVMARHWAALLEDRATLQLDLQTEQATLQLFQSQMAEAQAKIDGILTAEKQRDARLAELEKQLRETEDRLARAPQSEVAGYRSLVQRAREELEKERSKVNTKGTGLREQTVRVQDLAQRIEETSLLLHRLTSRHAALEEQLEERSRALAEVRTTAGKRADLEFRVRLLEQEIERLRQHASELTDRMGGLREVQVELWR